MRPDRARRPVSVPGIDGLTRRSTARRWARKARDGALACGRWLLTSPWGITLVGGVVTGLIVAIIT